VSSLVPTDLAPASLAVSLALAFALGLRHALDPDHLSAVATLTTGERRGGARDATRLGFAWGIGHALTLLALGVPVVIAGPWIPAWIHASAEVLIGALIAILALRLLARWRHGELHMHAHRHGSLVHSHPHAHRSDEVIAHRHAHPAPSSARAAFGVGLVHGVGGSAASSILAVAASPEPARAAATLAVFAAATAASMTIATGALGLVLARPSVSRRVDFVAPVLGAGAFVFGVWYAIAGVALVRGA
jgi:cytochrome c biogenesis protein CcdA